MKDRKKIFMPYFSVPYFFVRAFIQTKTKRTNRNPKLVVSGFFEYNG